VLPNDLELALWMLFDKVWPSFSGAGGVAVASGGVKQIRIGELSVAYDVGAAAAASTGGGAFGGLVDPIVAGILNLYRREGC
jgi:hypothetical protein